MKRIKGSLSIEGAIVLPMMILLVCSVLYFVKILYIQEQVQYAITEAAEEMAAGAYILDKAKILDSQQEVYSNANENIVAYEDNIDGVIENGQEFLEATNNLPSLYYDAQDVLSNDPGSSVNGGETLLEQGAILISDILAIKEEVTGVTTSLYNNGTALFEGLKILITDAESYAASSCASEGLEIVNTLVGTQITKGIVNSYISDKQYEAWGIVNGKDGMDYSRSKFMLENEDIVIVVSYQLEVPFFTQIIGVIPMKQSVCVRGFTGNENFESGYKKTEEEVKNNEEFEYVYITKNGTKYHTADCRHINIEVFATTYGEVKDHLSICSLCEREGVNLLDSTIVYVTESGTVFHTSESCSHICHTAFKVTKEDAIANGYTPCATCGGGD